MATFQITAPNGKQYRVTGDDPSGAMAALQKMIGTDAAAKVNAATNQPGDVPAYVPPGVDGYDPQTGEVQKYSAPGSAAMGAADTTTFGFGDEAAAGIGTLIDPSSTYDQNLAEIRGNQEAAQRDNSKSYLAGQIGGGVAQGVAAGPGVMASAPTLFGRIAGGMLTGGSMGGLYGLGSGTDLAGRGKEALINGGIGAAAGGAFPLLARGVSSAYSTIADALIGQSAARAAGTTPEALRMLGNVLDADGTRGPVGAANMARAGGDAMLADAGPNARAVLDTAIQRGGPGGVQARQAVTDRAGRAADAVSAALDQALGQPEGITAARDAIRQGSAGARDAAYRQAYEAPIDYATPQGMALEQTIRSRVPGQIINQANRLMQLEGQQSRQILARVADDGTVTFERMPDVRQLDYITRALNQAAESGEGAGALGGQTTLGRAYQGLSRDIRDNLRGLVPEYGQALDTAADPIRRSQAVDLGSRLLSPSVTRDQVARDAANMTGPERDALAQGVRSRIDDLMANVTRTVQDGDTSARESIKALKDLSSRANREKLVAAIGEERAAPLFAELDRAATSFDLRASVAENSKTYARQATDQRVKDITAPGFIATAAQGAPIKAGQRIAQVLTGQTPANVSARQDAIYSEIARLLTQPAGQAHAAFNAIDSLGRSDAATQLMVDRIARALGGPHLSYPTAILSQDRLRR